jgi:ATP phosphoribosyltransferase
VTASVITWALPKGRLLDESKALLGAAGVETRGLESAGRKLDVPLGPGHRALLLKPWDVGTYVELGVAHLGLMGLDVLREREPDVYEPLDLGIGRCRLAVAGPSRGARAEGAPKARPLVVASKYPNCTRRHFAQKGLPIEVVPLYGSVELAAATGLADLIVDLVSSGATLRENALQELETVMEVSTRLVVNRAWFCLHADQTRGIIQALEAKLTKDGP